jgi:hypothetical protein
LLNEPAPHHPTPYPFYIPLFQPPSLVPFPFDRSPAEPLLAIYTAESGQTPARVTLMRIPEKAELRQKNMYSVSGARLTGV